MDDLEDRFRLKVIERLNDWLSNVPDLTELYTRSGRSPEVDEHAFALIDASGFSRPWLPTDELAYQEDRFDLKQCTNALQELKQILDWHFRVSRQPLSDEYRARSKSLMDSCERSLATSGNLRAAEPDIRAWLQQPENENDIRQELIQLVYQFAHAREQYEENATDFLEGRISGKDWLDEATAGFATVADVYLSHANLRVAWLTNQICEWMLVPMNFALAQHAKAYVSPNRLGANLRGVWGVLVPYCISAVVFIILLTATVAGFVFGSQTIGIVLLTLVLLHYYRSFKNSREYEKTRFEKERLWHALSQVINELDSGHYNPSELIRRVRDLERQDVYLPTVFVSVMEATSSNAKSVTA